MEILTIILSVLASVISGMALFFLQKYFRKKDKRDDVRDNVKAKENILIIKSINAVGKLTVANSIALRDKKTNGEMHQALEDFEQIDKEMFEYLLERNSKK